MILFSLFRYCLTSPDAATVWVSLAQCLTCNKKGKKRYTIVNKKTKTSYSKKDTQNIKTSTKDITNSIISDRITKYNHGYHRRHQLSYCPNDSKIISTHADPETSTKYP